MPSTPSNSLGTQPWRLAKAIGLLPVSAAIAACGFAPTVLADDADLSDLSISTGVLSPPFDPAVLSYEVQLPLGVSNVALTASVNSDAAIAFDGDPAVSGQEQALAPLVLGPTDVTVVVTAPSGASNSYRVRIERGAETLQRAYLKASNADEGDRFGSAIALDGDTLAVGAPIEDSSSAGTDGDQNDNSLGAAGAVYVFVRSGDTWVQQAYLKASNPGFDDIFGLVIAVSGDLLAVGARAEDSSATTVGGDQVNDDEPNSGAVYIFSRTGQEWTQEAYVKAPNSEEDDLFGVSVDIDGSTLVVGADGEDSRPGSIATNDLSSSGAAYVFERNSSTSSWELQDVLKASNAASGDAFGISVAIDGDAIAVGGIGQSTNDSRSGAAWVFRRDQGVWSEEAFLKAPNPTQGDQFGRRIAISNETVVIGAPKKTSDEGHNDAGSAYVFALDATGAWTEQGVLTASNPDPLDEFGDAVSIDGDVIAIGAHGESSAGGGLGTDENDNSSQRSGAVYIFTRDTSGEWSQRSRIKALNADSMDELGSSVSVSGFEIAVGASREASSSRGVNGDDASNSAEGAGAAYILD